MEVTLLRFPHIAYQIFDQLDNLFLIQRGSQLSKIWGVKICKKALQASTQALVNRATRDPKLPYELLLEHKKNWKWILFIVLHFIMLLEMVI